MASGSYVARAVCSPDAPLSAPLKPQKQAKCRAVGGQVRPSAALRSCGTRTVARVIRVRGVGLRVRCPLGAPRKNRTSPVSQTRVGAGPP